MNLFKFLVGAATITVGACGVAGKVLVNACTNTSAEYKGFHFNK